MRVKILKLKQVPGGICKILQAPHKITEALSHQLVSETFYCATVCRLGEKAVGLLSEFAEILFGK
jgi:hypothetical protein